jgi:hypothetical protein
MRRVLLFLIFLGLCVTPVHAALVGYEGNNAATGPLNGVQTGFGLNAWTAQNAAYYTVGAPGLSFGSLAVSGNAAVGGGAYTSAGLTIQMPATWEADNGWEAWRKQGPADTRFRAGKEGTTLWASFLVEDWKSNDGERVRFADSHVGWNPGSHGVGVEVSGGKWQLKDIASGSLVDTGISRTLSETYLMVLKMDFLQGEEYPGLWANGSDRVTLYVNPTPGLAAPDVAGTAMMTSEDLAILNVHFYPGSSTDEGAFDELRFGASYADVTPIPEPVTIALLGLGGLAVLRRRS